MLACPHARRSMELGHFFGLLGNNLGFKLSWTWVQVLTLPFASTSRAKESSTNVGFLPCLPLRNSAPFFPVVHFCDLVIWTFSPTHPYQEAHGYAFYFLLPLVLFHKARISKTAREQSVFHGDLLSHPSPDVDVLLPLASWHVKKYIPSLSVCVSW